MALGGTGKLGGDSLPFISSAVLAMGIGVRAHTGAGQIAVATVDVAILGVLEEAVAAAGDPCVVGRGGIRQVLSGAAITAGDDLKVDAAGKFIKWATSGDRVGQALQAAGGADVLIWAFVF